MNLDSSLKAKVGAAIAVVAAGVIGFAVAGGGGGNDASAQTERPPGRFAGPTGASGSAGPGGGRPGGGQGGPGQMTEVTGTVATKAKEAALAEVSGTADRVLEDPQGGGYMVIVRGDDDTMTMVQVNDDFEVTNTQEMGTPPDGAPQGPGSGTADDSSALGGTSDS